MQARVDALRKAEQSEEAEEAQAECLAEAGV
jgi:hypothetical protein